ncbi:GTP pyrophosphokinase family protein [Neobacillus niacini]|uniref:GTP pyrophosphokinase n=1 Tax=Neobacillus niacini TaxID=86668 RepID=UPI00052F99F4|nr:GTP pyrophosphokinase family protein [Neobacillus niacini]KGM46263.1 GTP pyrophosphokinase [Neobacillus niacini]MEC1521145.1 GTP pyrophosphokinase family protein [Neobacillus niacini]
MEKTLDLNYLKTIKIELTRFMMAYKFALDEMTTKINILKDEFNYIHDYNPIEHVKSRLKSPESIFKKVQRKDCEFNLESIKTNIKDIAGIRITCSFISDIYEISRMIANQKDVRIIEYKDYIKNPKPNGYQSLHMIVEIPIFMSDREEQIMVEIQIRTIAMDFWASLEHKIYYKYNKEIPKKMLDELKSTAEMAGLLDRKMEKLHREMDKMKKDDEANELLVPFGVGNNKLKFLESFMEEKLGIK